MSKSFLLLAAALGVLGGCATPVNSVHVYTLQGVQQTAPEPAMAQGGPARFIDLAPVVLPERLRRPQIVLRTDAAQVRVLQYDRWSASLSDEMQDALSAGLQAKLDAVNVARTGANSRQAYRINIEFTQLDAQLDAQVQATVNWTVKSMADGRGQICNARFAQPAGAGVPEVVLAHQRLIGAVVDAVAASQQSLEGKGAAARGCTAS